MKKILILLLIILLLLLSGCGSKTVVVEPKPVDNRDRWMVLAPLIKEHFDTGDKTIEEIAFMLSMAEYNLSLE